jgi:hypothetical protein
LGTLLFILLIVLLLAVVLGAGGYGVRPYWNTAETEVVTTGGPGAGTATGMVVAILAMLVLVMLFFGFTQWSWFNAQPVAPPENPPVASPSM